MGSMKMRIILISFFLSAILLAQAARGVSKSLEDLCSGIKGLVPIAAMLLLIAAGPLGLIGLGLLALWYFQWRNMPTPPSFAKRMPLISAILILVPGALAMAGLLIVIIAPALLGMLYSGDVAC